MMSSSWVVSMTFTPDLPIEEKQLDVLSDRFDELDWSVAAGPAGEVEVVAYTDEPPLESAPLVIEIAKRAVAEVGVVAELVKVSAVTEEQREKDALSPQLPDLVAATDVAKILGVSRQRVSQLRGHHDFPMPVVQTGAGSLWTLYAIERFMVAWDRRPGRHGKHGAEDSVVLHFRARKQDEGDLPESAASRPGRRRG